MRTGCNFSFLNVLTLRYNSCSVNSKHSCLWLTFDLIICCYWTFYVEESSVELHDKHPSPFPLVISIQRKTPGPPFGMHAWKGLCIEFKELAVSPAPIKKCPNVLQIRRLIQYEPVTDELRHKLQSSVKVKCKNTSRWFMYPCKIKNDLLLWVKEETTEKIFKSWCTWKGWNGGKRLPD